MLILRRDSISAKRVSALRAEPARCFPAIDCAAPSSRGYTSLLRLPRARTKVVTYITPDGNCGASDGFSCQSYKQLPQGIIAERRAIADATARHPRTEIILLEDIASAAIAISRGWSTSQAATEEIIKIHSAIKKHRNSLRVKTVPGNVNPADEVSRSLRVHRWKAALFQHLFHCTSYCYAVRAATHDDTAAVVRHADDTRDCLGLIRDGKKDT